MTLDNLERPKHTLVEKSFYGAHQKNLNEDRPILSAAKCRTMILFSRNVSICGYSPSFLGEGASNDSGVVEDGNFDRFNRLFVQKLRQDKLI